MLTKQTNIVYKYICLDDTNEYIISFRVIFQPDRFAFPHFYCSAWLSQLWRLILINNWATVLQQFILTIVFAITYKRRTNVEISSVRNLATFWNVKLRDEIVIKITNKFQLHARFSHDAFPFVRLPILLCCLHSPEPNPLHRIAVSCFMFT